MKKPSRKKLAAVEKALEAYWDALDDAGLCIHENDEGECSICRRAVDPREDLGSFISNISPADTPYTSAWRDKALSEAGKS